jgi:hypothetical protein
MKIVSALGGGGSSFVLRALQKQDYKLLFNKFDTFRIRRRLERHPVLIAPYNLLLKTMGSYQPRLKVLMRPDSFWTDWSFHETGIYDPSAREFQTDLCKQRDYIIRTRYRRSAGFDISESDISVDSLTALVNSYLRKLEMIERESTFMIVLIAGHWGEYGIFKELDVEAIYLIRDPFNSLISHSKSVRHKKDYLRRGLDNINTKEWIDNYLTGPHHYWRNHAQTALEHKKAITVRYHRFTKDWRELDSLPDISSQFVYRENDVAKILTKESREYIYEETKDVCEELGLGTICTRYANL